jgi:hypothetical protein
MNLCDTIKQILKEEIDYKSSVFSESVTPNVVSSANNQIKNLSGFVSSRFRSKGIIIQDEEIQPYLNTYVNELNKKSLYITNLLNKKSPAKEIAKVYSSTLIYVFHQLFSKEMNWGKRMLVRSMVNKKELEEYRIGIWIIPYKIMEEAVESLPIDQTKKSEITKVLRNNKNSFSFDLFDYAIKTIYE